MATFSVSFVLVCYDRIGESPDAPGARSLKLVSISVFQFEKELPVSYSAPVLAQSTSASATVTLQLMESARQLDASGEVEAAEMAYRAATLCDSGPESRLALADFLLRVERTDHAVVEYEQLLEMGQHVGDLKLVEVVSHNLAAALRETGRPERAAALQHQSLQGGLEDAGEVDPADLTARAMDAIAQDDYALASDLLQRSLQMEELRHNHSGIAADCANLGVLASLQNDLTNAMRFLGRAWHSHLRAGDYRGAGTDMMNLVEVFSSANRWRLAARCCRRAISCFERSRASRSLATAKSRLVEVERVLELLDSDPLMN